MKNSAKITRSSISKPIAFAAAFAALCAVGTAVIAIPLPIGYFNLGDVFVLLAGWCLGPLYGATAAAVGSSLADVVTGFPLYAPATFFIKGCDALLAYALWNATQRFSHGKLPDCLARTFSAFVGEAAMVLGYFAYESILYDWSGALAAVGGNCAQGGVCLALSVVVVCVLRSVKGISRLFPRLTEIK